jgi:hypothetical protein
MAHNLASAAIRWGDVDSGLELCNSSGTQINLNIEQRIHLLTPSAPIYTHTVVPYFHVQRDICIYIELTCRLCVKMIYMYQLAMWCIQKSAGIVPNRIYTYTAFFYI